MRMILVIGLIAILTLSVPSTSFAQNQLELQIATGFATNVGNQYCAQAVGRYELMPLSALVRTVPGILTTRMGLEYWYPSREAALNGAVGVVYHGARSSFMPYFGFE